MFSSFCDNGKNIITNTNNKITNVNKSYLNFDYKSNKHNTYILLELFPSNDELNIDPNIVRLTKDYFYNYENKEKVYYAIDSLVSHPTNNTYKKIYFDKIETKQLENYINTNLNNKLHTIITYSMYHLIKTVFFSNNKFNH